MTSAAPPLAAFPADTHLGWPMHQPASETLRRRVIWAHGSHESCPAPSPWMPRRPLATSIRNGPSAPSAVACSACPGAWVPCVRRPSRSGRLSTASSPAPRIVRGAPRGDPRTAAGADHVAASHRRAPAGSADTRRQRAHDDGGQPARSIIGRRTRASKPTRKMRTSRTSRTRTACAAFHDGRKRRALYRSGLVRTGIVVAGSRTAARPYNRRTRNLPPLAASRTPGFPRSGFSAFPDWRMPGFPDSMVTARNGRRPAHS